ncbi:MAG: hypothetical protein OHK003_03710 [Anaerolineales bacterium]
MSGPLFFISNVAVPGVAVQVPTIERFTGGRRVDVATAGTQVVISTTVVNELSFGDAKT